MNKFKTIGCDLDGTLAHYDEWVHHTKIGEPILEMVAKVKTWIAEGHTVWIYSARMNAEPHLVAEIETAIKQWCAKHIGYELPVTGKKLLEFTVIYDDRSRYICPNLGVTDTTELINRFALQHMDQPWLLPALDSLRAIHKDIHNEDHA